MKHKRILQYLSLCILLFCLRGGQSPGGETHPEIFFARQLYDLGYDALAEDHLLRTQRRDFLPQEVRIEAVRKLALLYRQSGLRAQEERDFERKRRSFDLAIREYSRYIEEAGERIDRVERHILLYEMGELAYSLAMDAAENMRATVEGDDRVEYRQDAVRWFRKSIDALEESQDFFLRLRAELEGSIETDEDRNFFHTIQREDGSTAMALGNAVFEYARVLDGEERQQAFSRAIGVFEALAERYPIRAFRYQAFRQIGQCYRYLGEFEKAVDFLNRALTVREAAGIRWDRRIARLVLAQTFNEWGKTDPEKYDRAIVAADALISDVEAEAEVRADRDSVDMVLAAWIEKSKAYTGSARNLAQEARKSVERGEEAAGRRIMREARGRYQTAVDRVNEIAENPNSRWARNARSLLDDWIEESAEVLGVRIEVKPGITTYLARGMGHFRAGRYPESILEFMNAVETGDAFLYGATLIPEALYYMGLAYYNRSDPERDLYYYYEAALCFERIARDHFEADFAADAAFYCQQLYGALFRQSRSLAESGRMSRADMRYDGERYYLAMENFRTTFSNDARARDMQFQAAEIARAIGDYEQASRLYSGVLQEHHRYYESRFRAGYCLYLAALQMYEEDPEGPLPDRISELLQGAVHEYKSYMEWFDNNKGLLPPQELATANWWAVRTRTVWGRMLVHDVWADAFDAVEGAERALSVLEDIEALHMSGPDASELQDEFLPDSYFVIIQAHRRTGQIEKAERFVDDLADRYGQHELSSRAAGMLGYAYLQRRSTLDEGGGRWDEIQTAAEKAGRYLSLALELDPDQTLDVYNDTAAQLYVMGEYGETVNILRSGLERFPIPEQQPPDESQLRAVETIGMAYVAEGNWAQVVENSRQLIELEERINRATGGRQRNIGYRRNYARALEELELWANAADHWREVKALADRMDTPEGHDLQFESTIALARCHHKSGNSDRGHGVLAWYLLSSDRWLRRPEWAERVRNLYENYFRPSMDHLEELVFQFVESDPNLLRIPESRELIRDMVETYWPEQTGRLQQYLDRANVDM